MIFEGPVIRPPADADSVFIEVTVGCSHNACTFCNFYDGYPFKVTPLAQVEESLKLSKEVFPHAPRVWASGGNPFCLSVEKLADIAKLIRRYYPEANIATYGTVNDFFNKSVEDIAYLHSLGINDIVLGIETAVDEVLKFVNKGYTQADILEQCKKIEAAGMDYRVIYLGGLGGKGKGVENAIETAGVLNQLHPRFMVLTSVSVLPGTKLYEQMMAEEFIEATERERIAEYRALIAHLENPIEIDAATAASALFFKGNLPEDKEYLLDKLDKVLEHMTKQQEIIMRNRRADMKSV